MAFKYKTMKNINLLIENAVNSVLLEYNKWFQTEENDMQKIYHMITEIAPQIEHLETLNAEELWECVRKLGYINHSAFKVRPNSWDKYPTEMLKDGDMDLNRVIYKFKTYALKKLVGYYISKGLDISTTPKRDIVILRDPINGNRQITFHVGKELSLTEPIERDNGKWDGVPQAHHYSSDREQEYIDKRNARMKRESRSHVNKVISENDREKYRRITKGDKKYRNGTYEKLNKIWDGISKRNKNTDFDEEMSSYGTPKSDALSKSKFSNIDLFADKNSSIDKFEKQDSSTAIINKLFKEIPKEFAFVLEYYYGINGKEPIDFSEIAEKYKKEFGKKISRRDAVNLRDRGIRLLRMKTRYEFPKIREKIGSEVLESVQRKQPLNEGMISLLLMWAVAQAIKHPEKLQGIVNKIVNSGAVEKAIPYIKARIQEYQGNAMVRDVLVTLVDELEKYLNNYRNKGVK